MKKNSLIPLLLLAGLLFSASSPLQAQFVTLARKIKSMHTSQSDVATVMIDAKTSGVYKTVIDTLTAGSKFKIISRDNVKRYVEFSYGANTISMQVDSLAKELAQITVSAPHSGKEQKQPADVAVDAIVRICSILGKQCTLPGH